LTGLSLDRLGSFAIEFGDLYTDAAEFYRIKVHRLE
jgi:hypothetical protein